jgi:deoxyribodipyrimidine photo-lyase
MPHVIQELQLKTIIYWFRNDLRLRDNPAFSKACAVADRIIPVYVHDETLSSVTRWGIARTSVHREHFLMTALSGLDAMLRQKGSRLIELRGKVTQEICSLANSLSIASGQCEIHCEEIAAPFEQEAVKQLRLAGLQVVESWQSSMLDFSDLPFHIDQLPDTFTHLRTKIEKHGLKARKAQTTVTNIPALPEHLRDKTPASIDSPVPAAQANNHAYPGAVYSFPYREPSYYGSEQAATEHLENYFSSELPHTYKETRDQLSGIEYSTKFSPWLSLGALSAPTIVERLQKYETEYGANKSTYWIWFELLWRDYFRLLHLKYGNKLYRKQGISSQPSPIARSQTMGRREGESFKKWCEGATGVPLVDAAMHELVTTGYLSNRLRQVVASYLIYDLNLDWRAGAAWFESQLVDYDVYSNQGNWLYIAGRGSDPRGGRKFNIQKQTHDHDPQGLYRTSWGAA